MLCLAAFGVACMLDVREAAIQIRGDYIGATGFPRLVGGLLALTCMVTIVAIWRGMLDKDEGSTFANKSYWLILVTSGYILGISYVGFIISTLLYLFFSTILFCDFNRGRLKGIIIYSLAVTFVAFLFFKGFKVYLPDTILF